MTLLFKLQRTVATFSLTLMLKVRVLFIFLWRGIDSHLFELIHFKKNMKKNLRSNMLVSENSLSVILERIILV